jgi:hypothetical protein
LYCIADVVPATALRLSLCRNAVVVSTLNVELATFTQSPVLPSRSAAAELIELVAPMLGVASVCSRRRQRRPGKSRYD